MKSVISKSVLLGVALAAISGCSTSGDKTGSSESNLGNVGLEVQIANGNGLTLSTVGYSFAGPKTYTGNITAPQNSKTISGRVGNIAPGNYNVTLSGHPDNHAEINCTGTVSGLTVQAGKAAKANVSIVCTQYVADGGTATNGMIDVNGTASVVQVPVDCPIFLNDSASALEIPADGTTTVALTGSASTVSPAATLAWSAPSGTVVNGTNGAATFMCAPSTTDSTVTVSFSITSNSTQVQCPVVTQTIDIACTGVPNPPPPATGGAPGSGGTSATTAPATGGVPATGGNATGGVPVTGGTTSVATGGVPSTGGSSTDPIDAIVTAYVASNPAYDCDLTCIHAAANGCNAFESTSATFLSLVSCIMPPNGYRSGGSCYDYAGTNTAVSCYCGNTDSTTCTTTGGIGTCATQETAAGMTPGTVLTGFTDTSTQAGKANSYVNCLSIACGCFY